MALLDWLAPQTLDADTRSGIARTVASIDPLIKQVRGYERDLAPAVANCLEYCDNIAWRIPGPIEISRSAFASDPMVHALFASADDISRMLGQSQCVRKNLSHMSCADNRCCALLGMRHREKSGFGAAMQGDMLVRDAPRKTLFFSDHTLAELSPDAAEARKRLRDVLFDGIVKSIAAHVAEVRNERKELVREQAFAQARVRSSTDASPFTRQLDVLRQKLRASADALTPTRLIETIIEAFFDPPPYLSMTSVNICVDRSGVIHEGAAANGDDISFSELSGRDKRRWVVLLAHIDRDEARDALERHEQSDRNIVI